MLVELKSFPKLKGTVHVVIDTVFGILNKMREFA